MPVTPDPSTPARVRDDSFPPRAWGLPERDELDRVVIVSPHLDDAVLSCGAFMSVHAGVNVVTVFAGNPRAYPDPMRLWDVQSGFAPGDDVMEVRRGEDRAALGVLDAQPVHLDFVEHTYNPGDKPVAPEVLAGGVRETLRGLDPTLVLAPFGLANPDHDVVHRACMHVREELAGGISWWLYQDIPYHHIPGLLAWRTSSLFRRGIWPTPVCPDVDRDDERKRAAMEHYASQLHALDDDWQIREKLARHPAEQYWQIDAPPPGWEGLVASE
jgi:LmbE family N-acetylglucosaminyl deacetylase